MTVLTMTIRIYCCGYTCYGYKGAGMAPHAYCGYTLTYFYTYILTTYLHTGKGCAVASRDASGVLGLRVGLWEGLRQGQVYIYTRMCAYRDIYLYLSISMSRSKPMCADACAGTPCVRGLLG